MCRVLVKTLNVSILRGTTVVSVSQDSLEMDTTAQVCRTAHTKIANRHCGSHISATCV